MIAKAGALYYCNYLNWHQDKQPLLFVLYSDGFKTHGLNVHYISQDEYKRLTKFFDNMINDPKIKKLFEQDKREFYYKYLKVHFKDFIDVSYRTYHSMWLNGIIAHPVMLNQIGTKFANRNNVLVKKLRKDEPYKYLRDTFQEQSPTLAGIRDLMDAIKSRRRS